MWILPVILFLNLLGPGAPISRLIEALLYFGIRRGEIRWNKPYLFLIGGFHTTHGAHHLPRVELLSIEFIC